MDRTVGRFESGVSRRAALFGLLLLVLWPPTPARALEGTSAWTAEDVLLSAMAGLLVAMSVLLAALVSQARKRRRAEQSLRESEERMAAAAASGSLGLWQWDSARNAVWATPVCREILALPADEPLSPEAFLAALHPEDRAEIRQSLDPLQVECGREEFEFRVILPDGGQRWVMAKGRSASGPEGSRRRTGVVLDTTERRRADQELQEHRREVAHLTRVAILGELSGALAHELNQPLSAILSNANAAQRLLDREPVDLEEIRAILADIVADDNRAGMVIRHLRHLLQKKQGEVRPVDFNELIEEVLRLLHSDLIERRVRVSVELESPLPIVRCDPIQLQQVLLNLLLNAAEAMAGQPPGNRQATVRTSRQPGGRVLIEVADTGPGIEEEVQDRLFEAFVTSKPQGLGLGLSLSRSIVVAHGGTLESQNMPAGGALFRIVLPADEDAGEEAVA